LSVCDHLCVKAGYRVEYETSNVAHEVDPLSSEVEDEVGHVKHEEFDAVIIATPLEFAGLTFNNINLPHTATIRRQFQVTHATFVVGFINESYFGLSESEYFPNTIGTMENPDIPFSSISLRGLAETSVGPRPIYKLFSRGLLSEKLLSHIFEEVVAVKRVVWDAYPILNPRSADQIPPFHLASGICYANAFETYSSAMEISAIGARNCVLGIAQYLEQLSIHN